MLKVKGSRYARIQNIRRNVGRSDKTSPTTATSDRRAFQIVTHLPSLFRHLKTNEISYNFQNQFKIVLNDSRYYSLNFILILMPLVANESDPNLKNDEGL